MERWGARRISTTVKLGFNSGAGGRSRGRRHSCNYAFRLLRQGQQRMNVPLAATDLTGHLQEAHIKKQEGFKMNSKFVSFLVALLLSISCSFTVTSTILFASEYKEPQKISESVAGKYALYAMMSANAYHNGDRIRFPLELLGWRQVDLNGNTTYGPTGKSKLTGFAYDIYENIKTNDVVFAFRGTDDKKDWWLANIIIGISPQYKQAVKRFQKYVNAHPDKNITVTGHSLGGGIALGISARFGVSAFTFDPSPRIFDGLGDKHLPAARIVIYQQKEPLEFARKHWDKISEVVLYDNTYCCEFDFKGVSPHRSDYLAKGMLNLGITANKGLELVYDAVFGKPLFVAAK